MTTYAEDRLHDRAVLDLADPGPHTSASGVSWGAILAGAVGAAALSLILLLLGTGLGLSSVSPWSNQGASAATFGIGTILWITLTQIAASGLGGYLAGRLRTKWAGVHTDEVYFRDTAHGFLAWGVATLVTAAMLASAIGAILGAGAQAGASVVGGAATATTAVAAGAAGSAASNGPDASGGPGMSGYFVDSLFRSAPGTTASPSATPAAATAPTDGSVAPASAATATAPAAPGSDIRTPQAVTGETARIFATSIRNGALSPEDKTYVAQLIAQRTGLSQQDAEKRVDDTFNKMKATLDEAQAKAKSAAEATRKASAYGSLWLFISLLIGAFTASYAATYGGRRRDL